MKDRLTSLPDLLNKIADTLAMLGLGGPRDEVLTQKAQIDGLIAGNLDNVEDDVMEIASVLLLRVELNNFIANRSVSESSEPQQSRRRSG